MNMNKITTRKPWTDSDNQAVCALYFQMYSMQAQGVKFSKAPLVRELATELDRSKGSIEAKLMNCSGVMVDLVLVYVTGYKPLSNYQHDLKTFMVELIKEANNG